MLILQLYSELTLRRDAPDQAFDKRPPFLQQEFLERHGDRRQALVLVMHDVPLAHDRKSFDVEHRESSELELGAYRVGREKADSHACDYRLLDGFSALDLHRDI